MRAPDFWSESGVLPRLLSPLGAAYDMAGRLRHSFTTPVACRLPVICVGNLVTGGAGKTPVALSLARRLRAAGRTVHFLTRGYGGRASGPLRVDPTHQDAAEVGDEALLLAAAAPTWLARDRAAGARAAVRDGASVIVMDDGFQNPSLRKDLSFVVVDGGYGFGNGRVMPAGPLRETCTRGLARADAVILLDRDRTGVAQRIGADLPLLQARLAPASGAPELAGQRVVAFAGIGRPEKFFATLRDLGAELAEARPFPDHHRYRPAEVDDLRTRARALDALPITTEKDRLRLPSSLADDIAVLPVEVAWQDPDAVDHLLARLPTHG